MPKKKKGKGSKLARMSDEERARYLQHRAELEMEAKRRKQQLIAVFTKVYYRHKLIQCNHAIICIYIKIRRILKRAEQTETWGSILAAEYREDQRTLEIYSPTNQVQGALRRRRISLEKFRSYGEGKGSRRTAFIWSIENGRHGSQKAAGSSYPDDGSNNWYIQLDHLKLMQQRNNSNPNKSKTIPHPAYRTIYDNMILGRYKQRCEHLQEFFARERNRVASKDINELNKARENLQQHCNQLQNIIFGQDKEVENRFAQIKIRNAVNVYNIVYLVRILYVRWYTL